MKAGANRNKLHNNIFLKLLHRNMYNKLFLIFLVNLLVFLQFLTLFLEQLGHRK